LCSTSATSRANQQAATCTDRRPSTGIAGSRANQRAGGGAYCGTERGASDSTLRGRLSRRSKTNALISKLTTDEIVLLERLERLTLPWHHRNGGTVGRGDTSAERQQAGQDSDAGSADHHDHPDGFAKNNGAAEAHNPGPICPEEVLRSVMRGIFARAAQEQVSQL
jgi:hypothetical protein